MKLLRIVAATLVALVFAVPSPAVCESEGRPVVVGVLSDTHISVDPSSLIPLKAAFSKFSEMRVDAVVIAGDVCEYGTIDEVAAVMRTWHEVFAGGTNAAGRTVTPFFIWGNHDYHQSALLHGKKPMTEGEAANAILTNKDAAWRMITGESRHPGEVFMRKIAGLTFIGVNWGAERDLPAFLDANAKAIPTDRPVVCVQHPHPRGTCFHGWAGGDNGANHAALMAHPNFIVFSGHSHTPVYDDSLWMGGFVSIGAGSLRKPGIRRDAYNSSEGTKVDPRHMHRALPGSSWQASVLTVEGGRVRFARFDVKHNEPVGDEWVLDYPFRHDAAHPHWLADEARPPQFDEEEEMDVCCRDAKRYPDRVMEKQVVFSFPPAMSDGPHSRAVAYRVNVARPAAGELVVERLVQPDGLACSEERMRRVPVTCSFGPDELPQSQAIVVSVFPRNCGGCEGRPLVREFLLERDLKPSSAREVPVLTREQRRFLEMSPAERRFNFTNATYRARLAVRECDSRWRRPREGEASRFIRLKGVPNMRDLGGLKGLGGRVVKPGLVYRSAGFNDNAQWRNLPRDKWVPGKDRLDDKTRKYQVERYGIRTDLDLRGDGETFGMKGSPLGPQTVWAHNESYSYAAFHSEKGRAAFKRDFAIFLDEGNYPIGFHCIAGADRTGSLAYTLEALLGVSDEDMLLDWELTAFSNPNPSFAHRHRYDVLVAGFREYPGENARERAESFVKALGFTDSDIARFRAIMFGDIAVKDNRSAEE